MQNDRSLASNCSKLGAIQNIILVTQKRGGGGVVKILDFFLLAPSERSELGAIPNLYW